MLKELFLSLDEAFTALKDFSLKEEHLAFGFVSGSTSGSLNCSSQMRWLYVKLGWQALGITKHLLTVLKLKCQNQTVYQTDCWFLVSTLYHPRSISPC